MAMDPTCNRLLLTILVVAKPDILVSVRYQTSTYPPSNTDRQRPPQL